MSNNNCFEATLQTTMAFKVVILAAVLAVANAGYLGAPAAYGYAAPALGYAAAPAYSYAVQAPAIGASHQSTLRSLDGNSAVSHYSKAVDSAFSSVRKVDTRISNDAVAYAPAAVSYGVPAYAATPVVHHAPVAPLFAKAVAPAVASYGIPAYASAYHGVAAAPAYGYAAAPVVAKAVAAPIGVAYSAAPAVAHLSFDGLGVHYAY